MEAKSDLSFNGTLRLPITLGQPLSHCHCRRFAAGDGVAVTTADAVPCCRRRAARAAMWDQTSYLVAWVRRTDRNDGYTRSISETPLYLSYFHKNNTDDLPTFQDRRNKVERQIFEDPECIARLIN